LYTGKEKPGHCLSTQNHIINCQLKLFRAQIEIVQNQKESLSRQPAAAAEKLLYSKHGRKPVGYNKRASTMMSIGQIRRCPRGFYVRQSRLSEQMKWNEAGEVLNAWHLPCSNHVNPSVPLVLPN